MPPVVAETPREQVAEFARASVALVHELRDLSLVLRDSGEPLRDAATAARASVDAASRSVAEQSQRLERITNALDAIARANAVINPAQAAIVKTATTLDEIRDDLRPSVDALVKISEGLGRQVEHTMRTLDNFQAVLDEQSRRGSALETAAQSLNVVADRVLEELDKR